MNVGTPGESRYERRMPDFSLDRACCQKPVAGIDEAGRGPLAGPVVAAAVILDARTLPRSLARRIDDSKAVARDERAELFALLPLYALIGVGEASVEEIDALNILQATLLAMRRAVERLPVKPAGGAVGRRHRAAGAAVRRSHGGRRRPPQSLHRGRLHRRQGDARSGHGRVGARPSGLWLGT